MKNEREAALDYLADIFSGRQTRINIITPLVTEITAGTLRHLIYIDYIIAAFNNKKLRPKILNLLRISVYQLVFMDHVPPYAVINEAVGICRKLGFGGLCGFVNAVLRGVEGCADLPTPDSSDSIVYNSIRFSVPEWIVRMWAREYGVDVAGKLCLSLSERPRITVCVNKTKTTPSKLREILKNEGLSVFDTVHENALEIQKISDLSKLSAYKRGLFHVMDISSMLACDVIEPVKGASLLDVCAAPGGKAFYFAMRGVRVTAADKNPAKLELVKSGAMRLGLDIEVLDRDATVFDAGLQSKFDYVLVDAPCSGLGVLRKKPDIKLNRKESDIESLADLQARILENSAKYLRLGGYLLYSTCTLSKRENQANARGLAGFTLETEREIMPYEYESDGFYTAKLRR